jgi:hypothetical protein
MAGRTATFLRIWPARTPMRNAMLDDFGGGEGESEVQTILGSCRAVSLNGLDASLPTTNALMAEMAETPAPPEIFDSLPYYDDDLQKFPALKQKVDQELARQPKPPNTLHPRVPPPFELFAVREHDS